MRKDENKIMTIIYSTNIIKKINQQNKLSVDSQIII